MSRKLLELQELTVNFSTARGTIKAVKNVSHTLYEGKTHALVGESGSGKSVTARALIQLLPGNGRITDGKVLYHHYTTEGPEESPRTEVISSYGANSDQMRRVRTNNIGMIFQEPISALSPVHKCGEMIGTAIKLRWPYLPREQVRKKTVEVLGQVMISRPERVADQYSFELSGGMRQRVCIALAIVRKPQILIADEPTTALDVTTQKEILALIETMKRDYGLTVLFITHDMGVAAQISDDIVVMQDGRFVERNSATELFDSPQHPYTQSLISSTVTLEKRAESKATYNIGEAGKTKPVLEVVDLSMTFTRKSGGIFSRRLQTHTALNNVSFNLYQGETLGIVGESGSGKTTAARCIVGLYRNFSGSILFNRGEETIDLSRHKYKKADPIYRQIRMVFQDPFASLNPRLNVYRNIAEPLLVCGRRKKEIKEAVAAILEKVELKPDMMDRYPHAFSGGQRQRISIARAVIVNPTVLIADEATSALDVSLRSRILDLLNELQKVMGFSIIVITHDINTVKYCGDRMIVMKDGTVVESGTVEEVINSPQETYTQNLIASVPLADPHRRTLFSN